MKSKITAAFFILFSSLLFSSCMPSPYFQREEPVPQNAWSYDFKPSFKFDITDTASAYNVYFVMRHTQAYPYSNIYVWVSVKGPGESTFQKTRINIRLAEPSGKWLGRGMGEIYEQYMPISINSGADKKIFKKAGSYEIRFEQNMRINPLPEVLHVGLRIEKQK